MTQNKNQIIQLFIGNIYNAIVHEILENAIDKNELKEKYSKELKTSLTKAKIYRSKINPIDKPLPLTDSLEIKRKIISNVKNELLIRISKGYKNINLDLIEITVDKFLKETKVID